jgi:hypothetical protein
MHQSPEACQQPVRLVLLHHPLLHLVSLLPRLLLGLLGLLLLLMMMMQEWTTLAVAHSVAGIRSWRIGVLLCAHLAAVAAAVVVVVVDAAAAAAAAVQAVLVRAETTNPGAVLADLWQEHARQWCGARRRAASTR